MLARIAVFLVLVLWASPGVAQSPLWSGNYVPGHFVKQLSPGVLGDSGPAAGGGPNGGLTELGITNTGTPLCITDGPITGPYHQLCLGANASGSAVISSNAYLGASALPLQVIVNGTSYPFPGTGTGNVMGPNSSTIGHLASFNNTLGTLLSDSGVAASLIVTGPGSSVAGNIPTFSGTGGNVLQDSGIAVSSLAPKVSPVFTAPTLGAALATSINGLALTTTTGTLTIANGKTLTANNTLTFSGTDGSTLAIGSGGTLGTAAYVNTGTSGGTVGLLNGNLTFGGNNTFSGTLTLSGLSAGTQVSCLGLSSGNAIVLLASPCGTGGGSGTVNSGSANNLAYYAGSGTAVSGLATANNGVLITSAGGVPSISGTLPAAVQSNITSLGVISSFSCVTCTATTYQLGGNTFAANNGGYNAIYDTTGSPSVTLGNSGDHTNYYDQTTHQFRTAAASSNDLTISSAGINLQNGTYKVLSTTVIDTSRNGIFVGLTATGNSLLAGSTALATNATGSFPYIPTMAGAPTGVPASATAGQTAIVIDSTDHKICWFEQATSAWKCAAGI